jgi:hypothetical protein
MDNPVAAEKPASPSKAPVYAWWLVLGLVGLDYFSTLAYLPSIAVQADHNLAPLAALGVVIVTLLAALPVYLYVVGRSPHGRGATGLLERLISGWGGKVFLLILLGFVGTDFVITRTLSLADAAKHVTHNPYWQQHVEWLGQNKETVRGWLPEFLRGGFFDFWNEQLVLTLLLTLLAFVAFAFVFRGFNRPFLYLAAAGVLLFLVVNGIVIGSGLTYLGRHPERLDNWFRHFSEGSTAIVVPYYELTDKSLEALREEEVPEKVLARLAPLKNKKFADRRQYFRELNKVLDPEEVDRLEESLTHRAAGPPLRQSPSWIALAGLIAWLVISALLKAPQMILGLSGFELSMTSAPLVRGRSDDDPARPRGRIRRTRLLLVTAALIMSVFVLGSVLAVTQLVPLAEFQGKVEASAEEWQGPAMHRALAYLAHGGRIDTTFANRVGGKLPEPPPPTDVCPLFGPAFGTLYDASTVLILCLAGASVTIGLRSLLPPSLARYGMELPWAHRIGGTYWLFNLTIILLILVFHASVSAQQWAYGASVLALLTGASVAALLDLRRRWRGSLWQGVVAAPFLVISGLFLVLLGLTFVQNRSGLYIPLLFVLVVVGTGLVSRWLRSTELRFGGFTFADEHSQKRWQEICQLEFQVLVPHRPGGLPLAEKDREIRARHRLGPEVAIVYLEAELGDPSDFLQSPVLKVETVEGFEVVRLSRCASIAHALAAIGLEFAQVGRPPEIHFGWSEEGPLAANLNFVLFGEGNIPWMVHALLRKAEPDEERRPRVVVG